jgi:hypothetical protein
MSNDQVELIATSDVGPRIIHYGFVGARNMFAVFEQQAGKTGEAYWQIRGGHRLWIAPELIPDTYALDNKPVQAKVEGDTLTLTAEVEPETGLRKTMSVKMTGDEITITHEIENCGSTSKRFALWALSAMAPGGVAIAPFPPRASHEEVLLPTNPLTMWAYTDFSDPRWHLTKTHLMLSCDESATTPQKAGLFNPQTSCDYVLGSTVFRKRCSCDPNAGYPDFHCSLELFTNHEFLEVETLGALQDVTPGERAIHVEQWSLHHAETDVSNKLHAAI